MPLYDTPRAPLARPLGPGSRPLVSLHMLTSRVIASGTLVALLGCAVVCAGCGASRPSPAAELLVDEGAQHLAEGQLEQAEASLRLALEFEPGVAAAHANLGLVALARGDLEGAERALRAAIALREDFVEAWSDLGVVLERRGRDDAARAAYEHALSIHPGRPEPRLGLARLLVRQADDLSDEIVGIHDSAFAGFHAAAGQFH